MFALDRPGPDDRHLDHQVVKAAGLQPRQHAHLGPALDLEHAHRVGPADHLVHAFVACGDVGQRELPADDAVRPARSTCGSAVSMPRARQSTLRMPSSSRSSLFHWMTVRSGMAAFSIGTSSHSGPRVMTMPPVCCERCRGKPINCPTSSINCRPMANRVDARLAAANRSVVEFSGTDADRRIFAWFSA